jgi:hypothetical protein
MAGLSTTTPNGDTPMNPEYIEDHLQEIAESIPSAVVEDGVLFDRIVLAKAIANDQ